MRSSSFLSRGMPSYTRATVPSNLGRRSGTEAGWGFLDSQSARRFESFGSYFTFRGKLSRYSVFLRSLLLGVGTSSLDSRPCRSRWSV